MAAQARRRISVTYRIDAEVLRQLEHTAARLRTTKTHLVETVLRRALDPLPEQERAHVQLELFQ